MNQQLATASPSELPPINEQTLGEYLKVMGLANKLTQAETGQYLQIAQAFGLNPFKREIYCSKYGETFSIIVGFEVYLKRAERSGKLNGWECQFQGEGDDLSCTVTIYRKDWDKPFRHTAWYDESVQRNGRGEVTKFWQKRRLMTRKVAISQAFRMCFSDELGGMPYTNDELGVEIQDTTHEVVSEAKLTHPLPYQPEVPKGKKETADFPRRLNDWQIGIIDCETLEEFEAHRLALIDLKMGPNDLKFNFAALKKEANKKGFAWNATGKHFEPFDEESGEVMPVDGQVIEQTEV